MEPIPAPAQERLLRLMRVLEQQRFPEPQRTLTSNQAAALTGWPGHTIRKDISYLEGDFGGVGGYEPERLIRGIRQALGLDRRRRVCVVGLGRLGSAYLNVRAFEPEEFELIAGFDSNVNRVEILRSPVPLYPAYKMGEVIRRFSVEMALLCVPEEAAQGAAQRLAEAGIRGILNFAPVILALPPDVSVRNVYVADELRALAVKMGP
ncbi:MAG: redox-sensing transcriptional repressor Rex [Spirochaetaceae bacterium]|jgi:redox-sensing transcriptional repressor|nr:redox-sensing transcriptional repressor Rex [Spirochaetaceae bacterium]